MIDTTKVATDYIDLWNESDPRRRLDKLRQGWSPAATYVDPMGAANGLTQMEQLIETVRTQFPRHTFSSRGLPDAHGQYVRFSWSLSAPEGSVVGGGTDVVEVDETGRIVSVIGFLDEVAL